MSAVGTEGLGAGRVTANAIMLVVPDGSTSRVTISTDVEIAGRLAQFGRGVIDGVAKRTVAQLAECIRLHVEGEVPSGA
jgi:carbon monoxide dehydrogenase subunit G